MINSNTESLRFISGEGLEITFRGSKDFVDKVYQRLEPLLKHYNFHQDPPAIEQRDDTAPKTKKPYSKPNLYELTRVPIRGPDERR
jgi:hypothetical protein